MLWRLHLVSISSHKLAVRSGSVLLSSFTEPGAVSQKPVAESLLSPVLANHAEEKKLIFILRHLIQLSTALLTTTYIFKTLP